MKKKFTSSILTAFLFSTPLTLVYAQNQNALEFDGIDDNVTVPAASALIAGSNQISLTCWAYPTNASPTFPDFDGFAGIRNNLDADFYVMQYSPASTVEARFTNSAGTVYTITWGGLQLNVWNHFALTYNGALLSLYRNGQKVDSVAASGTITNSAEALYIGDLLYTTNHYYLAGMVDEVSLWNRALTPSEVNCIYHSAVDTSLTGLQLYYKFNQGIAGGNNSGIATLIDETGHINGTLNNFSLNGTASNFVTGIANYTPTTASICLGDSFTFAGHTYYSAGNYMGVYSAVNGCDSLVLLTLTVNAVNVAVTQAGITLTAAQAGAAYQWVDCNNNFAHITGATNKIFTAIVNGIYAVIITSNGCTDTSACYTINSVGIPENPLSSMQIYPNPLINKLIIEAGRHVQNISVSITDVTGKVMLKENYNDFEKLVLDISGYAPGVYLIKMTSQHESTVTRIVKK